MGNLLFGSGVREWDLIKYLITKIGYLSRSGLEFSHISEMNITFRTNLGNMSYNHYLEQLKPMIELVLYKKYIHIQIL